MGFYIRPFPGLKLRFTKRGVRAGIGPRWLRFWTGAGGDGVSTGAGPVSYYHPLKRPAQRKPVYHGRLPDGSWTCPHRHRSLEAAENCAQRELRRREST